MKAQDLRLGNFVIAKNEIIKIIEFRESFILGENDNCLIRCLPSQMKPIELTEEVLLKIGFKKDGNNYSLVCGDIEVGYYIDKFKQVLYINVSREKRFYKNELRSYDVKHLHQLQNAYYCLIGKELNIEL